MDEATDVRHALPILAAAVGGLAVGIERQWSGHATGPTAHFGGVRTFTLLGGLAGVAGWLAARGYVVPATLLVAAAAALVVAGYAAASRRDVDGTTEVAALVVLAAGMVAGLGWLALASAIIALTCLLLVEKSRLHGMVTRLDDVEVRAGARFAVMAVVVLPLLPEGPIGPWGGIRPRHLWMLVLLFSGLSFAGFLARRTIGSARGYGVAGLLGGLVSSTAVTLAFARASREDTIGGPALAQGVLAASTVMFARTLLAAALLRPGLAWAALGYLLPPVAAGVALGIATARRVSDGGPPPAGPANPLQVRGALQMAVLFQCVLLVMYGVRTAWGDAGLLGTSALLGLTDVDALTVALSAGSGLGVPPPLAARCLAVGCLVNTVVKLALAVGIGRGDFRSRAGGYLGALATAATIALLALW